MKRAYVPCAGCGFVGRRLGPLCSDCLGHSPNALVGGRWVLDMRRRIQVWEPNYREAS